MPDPDPDWDWDALFESITSLAVLVLLMDKRPMGKEMRRLSLERMRADTKEAAEIAAFLYTRDKEGREP
ncbi:hypothetical protein [Streptomyces sp. NPDC051662]|uniref:hypothetical protein n=1 Tax=unclassified Streptomyces TaxID=2593676 RepID=UPI003424D833